MINGIYGDFEFGSFDIDPPKENFLKLVRL